MGFSFLINPGTVPSSQHSLYGLEKTVFLPQGKVALIVNQTVVWCPLLRDQNRDIAL